LTFWQTRITYSVMRTVTVKLPEEVFQNVSRSAAQRQVSKSEIIREALSARETPGESLYSRIEDLVFDSAGVPRDLSSSPQHLKGYGSSRSR
jgi:hypothetical protein